jgi:hypothetical protein
MNTIPQISTEEAQQLGFPSSLFGFTPTQGAYWREPGLPWFTAELYECPLLGYNGLPLVPRIADLASDHMAPRFPRGCAVNTAPVYEKKNLVVGRVYTYTFLDPETGERQWEMGRLVKIGGNFLEVKPDNYPTPSLWLLRDKEREAVWDVWEVTHYVSYPAL